MSKLVYPTSRVVRGPLLLSKQQLSRLDEIVERQLPHIEGLQEQIWKRELAKDLERTARYRKEKFTEADLEERSKDFEKRTLERRRAERTRRIVLHLGRGRRLVVESFAEAARHPELMNDSVSSFELELNYYPARASVSAWGRES